MLAHFQIVEQWMKQNDIHVFVTLSQDIDDLVDVYTQSDRCHNNIKGYVKMTASQVKDDLVDKKGYKILGFCLGTVNNILNRLDYTLKKVRKTLPLKGIDQTDAILRI